MVTLLPEPDSPTMPSTSPASSDRLTFSTACSTPALVGKLTERLSISSKAMTSALELGIEGVAQPIAQQIEGDHGHEDRRTREGDDPPGAQHELARIGQHGAPFGGGRLRAQSEETQC